MFLQLDLFLFSSPVRVQNLNQCSNSVTSLDENVSTKLRSCHECFDDPLLPVDEACDVQVFPALPTQAPNKQELAEILLNEVLGIIMVLSLPAVVARAFRAVPCAGMAKMSYIDSPLSHKNLAATFDVTTLVYPRAVMGFFGTAGNPRELVDSKRVFWHRIWFPFF